MRKIRVLAADDSAIVRRLLTVAMADDPEVELVAVARNGKECVDLFRTSDPDAVILDVQMPVMDGVDALRQIRKINQRTPVLMFSSLTTHGAEAAMDAMQCGASDYAAKPSRLGHVQDAINYVRGEVLPKLKRLTNADMVADTSTETPLPLASRGTPSADVDVVAIAASTGGPQALTAVLKQLPESFPVPMLIVQHMPPKFTQLLADRLGRTTPFDVREATGGEKLEPGRVYLAPGDRHMQVCRQAVSVAIELDDSECVQGCRPAADKLFQSVARVFGGRCLGIVLTGMGQDGTSGARALHERGGTILVQDRSTSVVYGMPQSVAEAGLAHEILPLHEIPSRMEQLVCGNLATP